MYNPIDAKHLSEVLKSIIPPDQFYYFESIDSTNRFLKNETTIKPNTLSCCIADEQTAGRGRLGKTWVSPKGVNIYCSVGISLPVSSQNISGIGLIIGLSILKTLTPYVPDHTLVVKWPNDILCEHRKLCGILIERHRENLIIGIGINVNTHFENKSHSNKPWGAIYEFTEKLTDRNQLLIELLNHLSMDLKRFFKFGLSDFMKEWEKRDYLINKKIKMFIQDAEKIGFARGINETGLLKFEDLQGEMHFLTSGNASLLAFL